MKFTEAQLENAIIQLLGEQGYPHVLGGELERGVTDVLIEDNLRTYLNSQYANDDLAKIASTYNAWRGEEKDGEYEDVAGYSKAASLDDIKANDYVLTPGRYVGAADIEDDGIPFEDKMCELSQTLYGQMKEAEALDNTIRQNLEVLGYGE
jgi:type I restriction enzyme M protein